MAASQTDKFKKAGLATVTTLAAPGKALAATSITVGSTTNFPTGTGLIVAIRQVNTAGTLVAGTYTEWRATVTSGTSLAIEATPVAGSDQVYAAGSTTQVFVPLSSYGYNELVDGLLVSLDQDGTLKAGAVDNAAVLADDVVETAKIKDGAVSTAKLVDGAVTGAKLATSTTQAGYAEITSNFTTTSITPTIVTGLSATVTLAAGQKVKVSAYIPRLSNSALRNNSITIWDGAVGGTAVASTQLTTDPAYVGQVEAKRVYTPGAGTKTYNVSLHEDGVGTSSIVCSAASPAYLLIENIY